MFSFSKDFHCSLPVSGSLAKILGAITEIFPISNSFMRSEKVLNHSMKL